MDYKHDIRSLYLLMQTTPSLYKQRHAQLTKSAYRIAGIYFRGNAFRKVFADLIFVEKRLFAACMRY